jgi:hypothetical protein
MHEYDGKITDVSKPRSDIELGRLKTFERKLTNWTRASSVASHFMTTAFCATP